MNYEIIENNANLGTVNLGTVNSGLENKVELLAPEQLLAFETFKKGNNVFITGPAGTGKSYLIRKMVEYAKFKNRKCQVCALTGCAAVLLKCGAKTIHSWSGIGIMKDDNDRIIEKLQRNYAVKAKWKNTDLLIIDEVSMMSKRMLNLLNAIGKSLRRSELPFGGIQVCCFGDFYQLPPIGKKNTDEAAFCFESEDWDTCFPFQIQLTRIFRQEDPIFGDMLNQIRIGRIKKRTIDRLNECVGKEEREINGIKPTKLYPTKVDVSFENKKSLEELDGEIRIFKYKITKPEKMTKAIEKEIERETTFFFQNSIVEENLILKEGSQVMCVANLDLDEGICNGSRGIVEGFSYDGFPIVRFINGKRRTMNYHSFDIESVEGFHIQQIPLILAWAISCHKSQGLTLDYVKADVGNSIFACGQTYVALSRVRDISGLILTEFSPSKIKVHKKVQEFYERFKERNFYTTKQKGQMSIINAFT